MVKIEDVDFEDLISKLAIVRTGQTDPPFIVSSESLCRYLGEDGETIHDWDKETIAVMHMLNDLGYYFVS